MEQPFDLTRLAKWGIYFSKTWRAAIRRDPDETVAVYVNHPNFAEWLKTCNNLKNLHSDEEIERTATVMKRLRRTSIREYEVLYRIFIIGESIAQTTMWLNERAKSNHIPLPEGSHVHYREKDTLVLLVSGTEWALAHW